MKYRKETVKSLGGECVRYYSVKPETLSLSKIARRIEDKKGVSSIDTMRVIWNFFEEITPMLADGDKIDITGYCSLSAVITKDKDGKPKAGIQFNTQGDLKKAMADVKFEECSNTDKTAG